MLSTDALLIKVEDEDYVSAQGREMLAGMQLTFSISKEDFEYFREKILPSLKGAIECDDADGLLAMLTYGIHKAYEELEGVPFKYPCESPKA